ncbi:Rossmann-fold NAD(P)-binding domain-containing protein [Marinibacterium profundimaris]|uniref:Epimerase n=1 Tax=Marinibacterium profundimaris TaxID=1679460 RepID=A0A225NW17_9RHOB|nr:epimerase [Marinibacterium profundimaris]OWU75946.1 epimerase [Marinibacterium profundimaris]
MSRTALILGPTGRMGRHAAQAFSAAGWQVRPFDRATGDLKAQAKGAEVIVNAWNPPYTDWAAQLPDLHARVQQAALAADATVILPGNVYVFGPDTPPPWSTDTPHRATNPLGRARIAMEDSYRRSGTRTILLRAGDFLDTEASGNWFDRIIAPKVHQGRLIYPGDPQVPHVWAFLPDLARAMVRLADLAPTLPAFADIPFPGYTLSGTDLATRLSAITGHTVRLRPFPWWQIQLARPVWPLAKHLIEMRYLWSTPHWLDPAPFQALCPDHHDTPIDEALGQSIRPL